MSTPTFSRLSDGASGLLADVADGRLTGLRPDPQDPVSQGRMADVDRASVAALTDPRRITTPLKRDGDRLVPSTWDEALADIGERARAIRSRGGAGSLGLYLGQPVQRSSRDLLAGLSFGAALGTQHVFSELSLGLGPRMMMSELMIGHPVALVSDLGRAHQIVVFGGDQPDTDWGPGNYGLAHQAWIEHSRKTKGTKVVVAGPRKTPYAAAMNQYLAIRPGTEPFFLLGMLSAAVAGDWRDQQYVDDYTTGWSDLCEALAPWPVERCAEICGVEPAMLSGVALKFARSAMSVAHPDYSTFANAHAGLGAWAWLALHTITANTLRPGALYDHVAPVDVHMALAATPMAGAPRTRATDHALMALQVPADCLADEVLVPGEGQVRGLFCVQGDPAGRLAGRDRVREALGDLELLVCVASAPDETTAMADWVLPATHPWEQDELQLLDGSQLPRHLLRATPALVEPPGSCRRPAAALQALFAAIHPGLRGSVHGLHIAVAARSVMGADLASWEQRLVDFALDEGADALTEPPFRVDRGDADRSTWRIGHDDDRVHLMPEPVAELLSGLQAPVDEPGRPLWLRTSARVDDAPDALHRPADRDPGLRIHPDAAEAAGVADGAAVVVETRFGRCVATAHFDDTLRPDSVDLPLGFAASASALLSSQHRDPLCGVAARDGLRCSVEPQ